MGHLVTNYTPNPDLVAYDYAVGGSTVDGVKAQVEQEFLPYAGRSMSSAAWTAEDTLFGESHDVLFLLTGLTPQTSDMGWC